MNDRLPYSEAIRDFDPIVEPPPFLDQSLTRIAWEAWRHFTDWHPASVERLAEGIDRLISAVEEKGPEFHSAWQTNSVTGGDMQLLGFERAITGGLYRNFVCARIPGAALADALMVHALGAAAQANALAHKLDQRQPPSHAQYEEIAGFAMTAQELLGNAQLSRQGVLYAKWKASNQGQLAAEGRHGKSQELKNQFIEYYNSGRFRSRADAARRFFRSLSEDEQVTLAPSRGEKNAERTLTAALRQAEQ